MKLIKLYGIRVGIVLTVMAMLLCLVACGGKKDTTTVRITAIAGPTGVGLAPMMDEKKDDKGYAFTVVTDQTQTVAAIVAGDTDIAAVPTNMAASLYNKTDGNVQVLAVNTAGVLYLAENGDTVHTVADLRGKEIITSGKGATPEYALRYVLEKNGLNPDTDVTIRFAEDNNALSAAVIAGTASVALIPEPVLTACLVQQPSLRVALNLTEQWDSASASEDVSLLMGCVVARREFIEQHPNAVSRFLEDYEKSIAAATQQVEKTAEQCVTYGIIPKKAIAEKAIPRCGLTFLSGETMKQQLTAYLTVLYNYNPATVGGKPIAEDLCYEK